MKGLRKVIPRVVNPNPRECPTIPTEKREVVEPRTPNRVAEPIPSGVLPDLDEKKSTKTQPSHKNPKWNK